MPTVKLQQANVKNRNNHFYPLSVLLKLCGECELYGELSPSGERRAWQSLATIDLNNSSHIFTRLYMDGDWLMGEMKFLSTPKGDLLSQLFPTGCVEFALRGLVTPEFSKEKDCFVMVDYKLVTIDAVSERA